MSMKSLAGKKVSKTVKFMGEDVTINKLSVNDVTNIQNLVKANEAAGGDGSSVLRCVIDAAVAEAAELSPEEFASFPLDELNTLSNDILKFSGVGDQGK